MENEKIFGMYFAKVYPMLLAKGKKLEQILRKC